jgi:hypothetical protein
MASNVTRIAEFQSKQARLPEGASEELRLPLYGGGGPTGMEPNWKDYIDAKDEALETRVRSELSTLATAKDVRNNTWGAVAALLGIILATLAFGSDRFDGGISASPLLQQQALIQDKRDKEQDGRLELMDQKLDVLIKQTASK